MLEQIAEQKTDEQQAFALRVRRGKISAQVTTDYTSGPGCSNVG